MMQEIRFKPDFSTWRNEARRCLEGELTPAEVLWKPSDDDQEELEGLFTSAPVEGRASSLHYHVPAQFLRMAALVAVHRDPARWALLYRVLWRLTHGEPELLSISIDPDVARLASLHHSVGRDLHKMKAFVRFRETRDAEGEPPRFVAWYRPDHAIVRLVAPFFAERFQGMRWSILTEDGCAHWDGRRLEFSPGVPRSFAPKVDDAEALWKAYYASIFNPARIKTRAMKKELPVRYWKNLPETELIPALIQNAPARLQEFYANQPKQLVEELLPSAHGPRTFEKLRAAAAGCRACPIGERATQTVFGEGPRQAKLMLIGEQPGDQEDLQGRPFQGPAGQLLDRALAEAGIDRTEIYLTNAVKHFKWKPQGKIRLHQRPSSPEIAACKPWLAAEVELLAPEVIVCLGVTAAQSVFGRQVTLKELRGEVHRSVWCEKTIVTTHPSAILRAPDEAERQAEFARLVEDLRRAAGLENAFSTTL